MISSSENDNHEQRLNDALAAWNERREADPIAGYDLLEEIGRGGMGIVYRARHRERGRIVALKLIRAGCVTRPAEVEQFRSEASLFVNREHPNLVPVYEVGEHAGGPFVAMKYIEGRSLAGLLRHDRLDPRPAGWLMARVARAVDNAHRLGVRHGGLAPCNILLDEQGQPHVAGFGLAAFRQGGHLDALTPVGDLHALGAILYECLTGRAPFAGDSLQAILRQAEKERSVGGALLPRLDGALAAICLKCLQLPPGQHYRSPLDLAEDLERWLYEEQVCPRPVGLFSRLWRWCRGAIRGPRGQLEHGGE
jgi:serine/threonine-protein kinase